MIMRTTSDARSSDVSQVLCFKVKFENQWKKQVRLKVYFVLSHK